MSGNVLRVFAAASDIAGGGTGRVGGGGMAVEDVVATVIRVVLWVVGILAVAMIIYGGARYAMSQGDSSKVTSAKNTIMYAVIGLIVAIIAYAIVGFVMDNVGGASGETPKEDTASGEA